MRQNCENSLRLPDFVDRRFQEARANVRNSRYLRRSCSDLVTRSLAELLRQRHSLTSRRSSDNSGHDADLLRALEIYEERGVRCSKTEAYLLTGLTFEQIAERVQESTRAVELYSRCFFDVRRDLSEQQLRDIVAAFRGTAGDRHENDSLWKLVAVAGGAESLDAMLAPREVNSAQDAAARAVEDARALATHRIADAVQRFDLHGAADLRELRMLLEELRAAVPDNSQGIQLEFGKVLTSICFWAGGRNREGHLIATDEFSQSAVELNLDETMVHGFGKELVHRQELLDLHFPENAADPLPSAKLFLPKPGPSDDQQPTESTPTSVDASPKRAPTWEELEPVRLRRAAAAAAANQQSQGESGDETSTE